MKFLQIHTLTSYPCALINRDDSGFSKRIPFGGVSRTRISSQCLKRHWRTFTGDHSLIDLAKSNGHAMAIRSRETFTKLVCEPLVAQIGTGPAQAITECLASKVLGESIKKKKEKEEKVQENAPVIVDLGTEQVVVLGYPEIEYLKNLALTIASEVDGEKDIRKATEEYFKRNKGAFDNLKTMRTGAGLDAALFGRMVTSDILARHDAAVHVAHAFTVHAESVESDYFAAVDDLKSEMGSGHINTSELTSGLYYGYVVVDLDLLQSNLSGDRALAAQVSEHLTHLVATVSPGAKLGATAPYSYAHWVMAEFTNKQPRTLVNAFLAPVFERPNLLSNAYHALASYVQDMDNVYGISAARRFVAVQSVDALRHFAEREEKGLQGLGEWVRERAESSEKVKTGQ